MIKVAKTILAIGPVSQTGAAFIHFATLERLRTVFGYRVYAYALSDPDIINKKYPQISIEYNSLSGSYNSVINNTLSLISTQEKMIRNGLELYEKGKIITVFATYLFPYAFIASNVKLALESFNIPVKLLVQPAGSDIWKYGTTFQKTFQQILVNSNSILSYSAKFAKELENILHVRDTKLCTPEINTNQFKPVTNEVKLQRRSKLGLNNTDIILICISNNRYIKAIENCIILSNYLADRNHLPTWLLIIGPSSPELEKSLNSMQTLPPGPNGENRYTTGILSIAWFGTVSDVTGFLHAADIFINTSYHDSFNTSLGEAMASGIPVISSSIVGIKEYIRDHKVGYFFDYTPIPFADLQKTININIPFDQMEKVNNFFQKFITDIEYAKLLKEDCRRFIEEYFSWDALHIQYAQIFE